MMNIKRIIYLVAGVALMACSADDELWQLAPEQQELIGQGVNFSATIASPFVTRTTYNADGSFNEGDELRIFRQYATDNDITKFDADGEIFRTYYRKVNYAAGNSLSLGSDWLPKAGRLKSDAPGSTPIVQTAADSLTWENGRTVRFRAWGRSNLSGCMSGTTPDSIRSSFYPDFTVSDWVTVSGPTQNIPLTMRHIACRIALTCKPGNEFSKVELCTNSSDYDKEKDYADVMAVFNKMCVPAGVDDSTFLLTAMTQDLYQNSADLNALEANTKGVVKYGKLDSASIRTTVQHPSFRNNNGRQYLMAIPVDMSKESAGSSLVLPACTRFRVYLRGDGGDKYHYAALSEIKNKQGNYPFKDGITLRPGYSYSFSVGYQYDSLTITAADSFAWTEHPLAETSAADDTRADAELDFQWWIDGFQAAIEKSMQDNSVTFNPEFLLTTPAQFVTFMRLCNGTALNLPKITRGELRKDEDGKTITIDGINSYWWTIEGDKDENGELRKYTRTQAQEKGYKFYPIFHKSVSTNGAYAEEMCVDGPYNFYDEISGNRFMVKLAADLDLVDWQLPGVATQKDYPFRGQFNGQGHKLRHVYLPDGYLFHYVMDGAISNLQIESTHDVNLLREASASKSSSNWGCRIAGISMRCPSSKNAIATKLNGTSHVVGCIHVGDATEALVGSASNLTMIGCMQAAAGIAKDAGALLGSGTTAKNGFKYNYYDTELSPGAVAVGGSAATYDYDLYVRGAKSHVLKAKNDYMINPEVDKKKLSATQLSEMYGIAPWKAMNQGIEAYNTSAIGKLVPCQMKYEMKSEGFANRYPELKNEI